MQHLSLAAADWNVERKAVLHEWDEAYESSFVSLFDDVKRAIYPTSPLGKSALGERADVERATVADLRAYYRTWYAPNNATIVVTGDVRPADVFAAAETAFANVPSKRLPPSPIVAPVAAHGATVEETSTFPIEVDDVAYALPGNSAGTEGDAVRTGVFAIALNNPRSVLRAALVDSGVCLAYAVLPDYERHSGVAHAILIVTPGHSGAQARGIFRKTLAGILADGLPSDFFDAAKRKFLAQLDLSRDSLTQYADAIGGSYVFPGESTLTDSRERMERTTVVEVNDAARRYFAEPGAIGIMSPQGHDLSKFKPPSDVSGTVVDSFSNRIPTGKIVQPPAIRESLQKPLQFQNAITPVSFELPNGLQVFLQEDHANPTVFVAGSVAASPAFQPAGKEGVADLTGSALAFGSAAYDYDTQHEVADRLGADIKFGTTFHAHGYAKDFAAMLGVLADDLERPALPSDRLDRLRARNVAAYKALDVLAAIRAQKLFDEALYPPGDPALRTPTATSLASITNDDVRAYARTYLRPDLVTLAVVGDMTEDQVRTAVTSAFGTWSAAGPRPNPALPPVGKPKAVRRIVHSLGSGIDVQLGQIAPGRASPDFDTFALMNSIFGNGSFDSRLFRELREKRGLVYSIASRFDSDVERGTLTIEFATNAYDEEEAIAGVRSEMLRLRREPVTAQELTRGKIKLVSATLISEQSTSSIADDLLELGRYGLPLDYYGTLYGRYQKITSSNILQVARDWFDPQDLIELRVGP
jgi:zinc protease